MSWFEESFQNISKFVSETFTANEWFRLGVAVVGIVIFIIVYTLLIECGIKIRRVIIDSKLFKRWKTKRLRKQISFLSTNLFDGDYQDEIHLLLSKSCSYLSIGDYDFLVHGLKRITAEQFTRMRLGALLKYVANSKDYSRIKTLEKLLFERRNDLMNFNEASEDWEVSDAAYSWTVLRIFENEETVKNSEYLPKLEELSKLLKNDKHMKPNDVVSHFLSERA